MIWEKLGCVYRAENVSAWWAHTTMAPAALAITSEVIRVYCGGRDAKGISRIAFIDVDATNPLNVLQVAAKPVLDIGAPGCFDDNGVFPGHVYCRGERIMLYYTGFQLLQKIRFTNFCGLAISEDGGETFCRVSQAPVMDRSDEGLFTRAGTSVLYEDGIYKTLYSAGSTWEFVAGQQRPIYDIFYQESIDGIHFSDTGKQIISCAHEIEHGLGRPQLIKLNGRYYAFYTRRTRDFRYHMGVATSRDGDQWSRVDHLLASIAHGEGNAFDSEMVYFPCLVDTGTRIFLFYSGNGFGLGGLGVAELKGFDRG